MIVKNNFSKRERRTPRNYDGSHCTNRQVAHILPHVLQQMHQHVRNQSALVLAAWPTIIGPKLSCMTHAVKFTDGVLVVKVKNSTLFSLLTRYEKAKLVHRLKKQFPQVTFRDIFFRIG